jgi:hypothetical protein|nr:MAG TPA: internal head protein [Caudoviricetes sp.]
MGKYVPKSLRDDYRLSIEEEVVEAEVVEDTKTVEVEVNPEPDATKVEVEVDPTPDVEVADDTELEEAQDKVEEVSENIAEASDVLNRATDMQGNVEEALVSDNKDNVAIVAGMATEALRDVRSKLGLSSSSVSVEDISKDPYASLRLSKEGLSDVIEKIIAGIRTLFKKLVEFIKNFVSKLISFITSRKTEYNKLKDNCMNLVKEISKKNVTPYDFSNQDTGIQKLDDVLNGGSVINKACFGLTLDLAKTFAPLYASLTAESHALKSKTNALVKAMEIFAQAKDNQIDGNILKAEGGLLSACQDYAGSVIPIIADRTIEENYTTYLVLYEQLKQITFDHGAPKTIDGDEKVLKTVALYVPSPDATVKDNLRGIKCFKLAQSPDLEYIIDSIADYDTFIKGVNSVKDVTTEVSASVDTVLAAVDKYKEQLDIKYATFISLVVQAYNQSIQSFSQSLLNLAGYWIRSIDVYAKYFEASKLYVDNVNK